MEKREFIIEFVLNRAKSGCVTDGRFWVRHANAAWDEIEKHAPPKPIPSMGRGDTPV